jgi:hypothetical protein
LISFQKSFSSAARHFFALHRCLFALFAVRCRTFLASIVYRRNFYPFCVFNFKKYFFTETNLRF